MVWDATYDASHYSHLVGDSCGLWKIIAEDVAVFRLRHAE